MTGSLCDQYIESDGYIFSLIGSSSQSAIRNMLQFVDININNLSDEELCRDQVSRVVCSHFYPSCGSREGVHLPLSLCREECEFVSESCGDTWRAVMMTLMIPDPTGAINCATSSSRFGGVSAFCVAAGINITDGKHLCV